MEHVGSIDFHSPTYFTLDELDDVDWDEYADAPDNRISVVDESGETKAKGAYMSGIHESLNEAELAKARGGERVEVSPTNGEARYAVHKRMTRREALSGAWQWILFDYMSVLADRFDNDGVRMVVWFDN
jgi:hypothetical protein